MIGISERARDEFGQSLVQAQQARGGKVDRVGFAQSPPLVKARKQQLLQLPRDFDDRLNRRQRISVEMPDDFEIAVAVNHPLSQDRQTVVVRL